MPPADSLDLGRGYTQGIVVNRASIPGGLAISKEAPIKGPLTVTGAIGVVKGLGRCVVALAALAVAGSALAADVSVSSKNRVKLFENQTRVLDSRAKKQYAASVRLTELFIEQVEARCPSLTLASPRSAAERGSQVSFSHPEAYAVMQAIIARGVIGDFRAPDLVRFGFTPLYLDQADVRAAVDRIEGIFRNETWRDPRFQVRAKVT